MTLAAAAAYKTVSSDQSIDTLHAHFLSGPDPNHLLRLSVQRLTDGGRFAVRAVTIEQAGRTLVHVSCSFVRIAIMKGRSMKHATQRSTDQAVERITLDDLEPGNRKKGPYMKFQRLPLVDLGNGTKQSVSPETKVYTSVAQILSPISNISPELHNLGIIYLSDYHILDGAPTLHGLTIGLPAINDTERKSTRNYFERMTSLNHTIRFHAHEGFRADDLCYIEVTTPWTGQRRAEVNSKIFNRAGMLIATCVQEAYFVMKEEKKSSSL